MKVSTDMQRQSSLIPDVYKLVPFELKDENCLKVMVYFRDERNR